MFTLQPNQRQTILWITLGLGLLVVLYSLSQVLIPFLCAAILAYILNPGVDWLSRHRWPRWLAVLSMITILMTLIIVLLLVILPVLQKELFQLQQKLPELVTRLNNYLTPKLNHWLSGSIRIDGDWLRQLISQRLGNQDFVSGVLSSLRIGGMAILGVLGNLILIPMVLFYLLIDWHLLLKKIQGAIPRAWYPKTMKMFAETDDLLAQFLRGQLWVMILLAMYYSITLSIAGFEVALPVGIFTGLLVFVPYLGYAIGLLLAIIAAALQYSDWYGLIAVAVIYGFGQLLESFILTPRLVGQRIGLHPLAVIFALLAFGQWFGFFGILLALPASAALLVGLRHLKEHYLASEFYQQASPK